MSAAAEMAIVLSVVFLGGVTVGIIAVIAMSARRADTTARRVHRAAGEAKRTTSPIWGPTWPEALP
jgi:hypothetical protein